MNEDKQILSTKLLIENYNAFLMLTKMNMKRLLYLVVYTILFPGPIFYFTTSNSATI